MKYPYITIDQRKPVLIYKDRRGIYMVDENDTLSGLDITYVKNQKNQTAKVLANTYGKVKSKEHAEFIKLLAETNDIPCAVLSIDMNYTIFYVIDGCLFFCLKEIDVVGDYKKITIPLPPECESVDDERKPLKVLSSGRVYTFNEVTEYYDYNIAELGYVEGKTLEKLKEADDYEVISFIGDDEWPKVGDDAILVNENDYGVTHGAEAIGKKVKVMSLFKDGDLDMAAIKHDIANYCFRADMLQKPKTPEQELAEKLIEKYKHLGKKEQAIAVAKDIVQNAIDKYSITKKPQ